LLVGINGAVFDEDPELIVLVFLLEAAAGGALPVMVRFLEVLVMI
jgi:hypothetical protein